MLSQRRRLSVGSWDTTRSLTVRPLGDHVTSGHPMVERQRVRALGAAAGQFAPDPLDDVSGSRCGRGHSLLWRATEREGQCPVPHQREVKTRQRWRGAGWGGPGPRRGGRIDPNGGARGAVCAPAPTWPARSCSAECATDFCAEPQGAGDRQPAPCRRPIDPESCWSSNWVRFLIVARAQSLRHPPMQSGHRLGARPCDKRLRSEAEYDRVADPHTGRPRDG